MIYLINNVCNRLSVWKKIKEDSYLVSFIKINPK